MTQTAPVDLLRLSDVKRRTGLGRSTIYRLASDPHGHFPRPIRITGTTISAWSSVEVDAWIAIQLNSNRKELP